MVATASPAPSSLAGPSAPGRSASRIASDRRGDIEVLPETAIFEHLNRAGGTCIGRARPHRGHSHPGRRRFSGQTGSGRYCRARYYDPQRQRFASEDPIGHSTGDTNAYVYVRNNPMRWTDPEGLRVRNPTRRPISPAVLRALEDFNACIGQDKDIVITSGDRPRSSPLGAGAGSTHAQGIAVDFVVPSQAHSVTAYQAKASGLFGGVGWYEEG
jgi:RHS repeat-associated protein